VLVPLLFAVPFGPLLAWKRGDLAGVAQRLLAAFGVGLLAIAATMAGEGGGPVLAPFGVGLAVFIMAGALTDLAERTGLMRTTMKASFSRAVGLPRAAWGTALAHFAVGVTLLGMVGETQWGAEAVATMKPGQTVSLRHYDFTYKNIASGEGPNYRELAADFVVQRNGATVATAQPSKRFFQARDATTTEAALITRGLSQLYISLGDIQPDGTIAVRIYHKPLVLLIWLGPLLMMFGGLLSLSDRRLRVGAPRPARAKLKPQPAE
jgi:cytochrome c-type biogenesis protein CcmF